MKKEYIISHPSQLNSLSTLPIIRNKAIGKIVLTGNMENHSQKEHFEKELNRKYRACGCDTGAKGLFIGLLLGIGYSFFKYSKSDWSITNGLVVTFAGLVIMSGVGKLYGLFIANKKLKTTIEDVKKVWIPEKEIKEEDVLCG